MNPISSSSTTFHYIVDGSQLDRVNSSLTILLFGKAVATWSLMRLWTLLLILRDPRGAGANACHLDGRIPAQSFACGPRQTTQLLSFKPLALARIKDVTRLRFGTAPSREPGAGHQVQADLPDDRLALPESSAPTTWTKQALPA